MAKNSLWKKIGIIGGYGPKASTYFLSLLVVLCSKHYGATNDIDYPPLYYVGDPEDVISSTSVLSEKQLISNIKKHMRFLVHKGCDVLAIPCNTVYGYIDELGMGEHIVSLPLELANESSRRGFSKVIMLGGDELRNNRFYDRFFRGNKIEIHYPNDTIQLMLDQFILDVMGCKNNKQTTLSFQKIISEYKRDFNGVVIGCSELSVLVDSAFTEEHIIDGMITLAKATLRNASLK